MNWRNRGNTLKEMAERIYTLDLETDPFPEKAEVSSGSFESSRPEPFAACLYDGECYWTRWGVNCVAEIMEVLYHRKPGIVYMHNGGKFDIFYMLEYIDTEKPLLIIQTRVAQCEMKCFAGHHKVRDSLKILPFPLAQYQKTKIDYNKMKRDVREDNRTEIEEYLEDDCKFLHELCADYVNKFGTALTIGTTAMRELQKRHDIGLTMTEKDDACIRRPFFFGGRVERYQTGVLLGDWKVYDVNSMYPHVMASFMHPIGRSCGRMTGKNACVNEQTAFITARGYSRGAFPQRIKANGIESVRFPTGYGEYSVTIHEWNAAIELGLFDLDELVETVDFWHWTDFSEYVHHYYNLRRVFKDHLRECEVCDDKERVYCDDGNRLRIDDIFYKYLLNNSYGKFAINPRNFKECRLSHDWIDLRWEGYERAVEIPQHNLILWQKDVMGLQGFTFGSDVRSKFVNVATGASITGAARSVLMRGLASAIDAVYLDTDCIICRGFEPVAGIEIDDANLGAWKLEKTGNRLAIAGRKMYALWQDAVCVKYASKGVRISPEEIERVALGETITDYRNAPTFRLDGSVEWLTRRVRIR